MSVTVSSQDSLTVKTRYNNKPAVIVTEVGMDSIVHTYIRYQEQKDKNENLNQRILNLELQSQTYLFQLSEKIEQNRITKSLNKNLETEVRISNEKLEAKDLLLEQKAKEKLPAFLLGTAVGTALTALIVLILSIN